MRIFKTLPLVASLPRVPRVGAMHRRAPMPVRAAASIGLTHAANMQLGNSMQALHNIIASQRPRHISKEAAWYSNALALVEIYIKKLEFHAFLERFVASPAMNAHEVRNFRNMHAKLVKVSRNGKERGLITAANANVLNKKHNSARQAIKSLTRLRGALAHRAWALAARRPR
jgi:hypothetical protein